MLWYFFVIIIIVQLGKKVWNYSSFFVKLHDSFFFVYLKIFRQIRLYSRKTISIFCEGLRAGGFEAGLCPYFFCSDHIFKTIFLNIFFHWINVVDVFNFFFLYVNWQHSSHTLFSYIEEIFSGHSINCWQHPQSQC